MVIRFTQAKKAFIWSFCEPKLFCILSQLSTLEVIAWVSKTQWRYFWSCEITRIRSAPESQQWSGRRYPPPPSGNDFQLSSCPWHWRRECFDAGCCSSWTFWIYICVLLLLFQRPFFDWLIDWLMIACMALFSALLSRLTALACGSTWVTSFL